MIRDDHSDYSLFKVDCTLGADYTLKVGSIIVHRVSEKHIHSYYWL